MKKIFLLVSLAFFGASISSQAATITVADDEETLDANIRLPMKSVRKHYTTPEELLFASNNSNDKKEKKKVMTKEEAERYVAEQKAKQEAEEARRRAELEELLKADYSIVQYVDPDPEPYKWEDEEEISTPKDSLLAQIKTGPVTAGGETEYVHKEINTDYKENDFYFYFKTINGVPEPLRFVAHYYADDPIDFVKLKLTIDDFKYEYTPTDINKTSEGKFYIENFDNVMNTSDEARNLVAALAHCSYYANMVLVSGSGVSHRIFFTPDQLRRFRQTYELFRLMGGKL